MNAMQAVTDLSRDVGLRRKKPVSARFEQAFEGCEVLLRSEGVTWLGVYTQT